MRLTSEFDEEDGARGNHPPQRPIAEGEPAGIAGSSLDDVTAWLSASLDTGNGLVIAVVTCGSRLDPGPLAMALARRLRPGVGRVALLHVEEDLRDDLGALFRTFLKRGANSTDRMAISGDGLATIVPGDEAIEPWDMLEPDAMRRCFAQLRTVFPLTVLNLVATDARRVTKLARNCDATLVHARQHRSPVSEIRELVGSIKFCSDTRVGVVLEAG